MGSLGWLLASAIGSIVIGLFGAWARSEIAAFYDPLLKFLVRKAASRLPEELQTETQAEFLAFIEDIRSPTMKLVNALSLLLQAGETNRAIAEAQGRTPAPSFGQSARQFFFHPAFVRIRLFVGAMATLILLSYITSEANRSGGEFENESNIYILRAYAVIGLWIAYICWEKMKSPGVKML